MSRHAKGHMREYVQMCYTSLSLFILKSPVRPFPKYSVREGIAETPCPIWNRLLTLTSSKNRDPTAWNGSRSYTTCSESFRDANTMNDVNIGKKRFKAFTHAAMNLSMSLLCSTLLTESQNRPHMSLNSIILLKWLTGYRVLTKNDFVMVYLKVFIPICDMKKRR